MRLGALAGAAIGVWAGLALTIGLWEMLLVTALGVVGLMLGRITIDSRRRPRSRASAHSPRRYEREDLADHLAAPVDAAPELDVEPWVGDAPRRR
jgi:uncharacterized membrane protein